MDYLSACDHIGVYIGRVGRFYHKRAARPVEKIQYVSEFIARAAGNKHFVVGKIESSASVVFRYRPAQLRQTEFGHVSVESLFCCLIIHRLVESFNYRVA